MRHRGASVCVVEGAVTASVVGTGDLMLGDVVTTTFVTRRTDKTYSEMARNSTNPSHVFWACMASLCEAYPRDLVGFWVKGFSPRLAV